MNETLDVRDTTGNLIYPGSYGYETQLAKVKGRKENIITLTRVEYLPLRCVRPGYSNHKKIELGTITAPLEAHCGEIDQAIFASEAYRKHGATHFSVWNPDDLTWFAGAIF